MRILYLFSMTQNDGLTRLDGRRFCMTEYLFTRSERKLIHQFNLLRLLGIVLHLRFDKDTIAGGVIPNMHAKGFNTHSVRFYQTDRTEDTKGLTALRESPFRRAAATYPRRFRLHGGVVNKHMQGVLAGIQSFRHIKGKNCASYQFLRILRVVERNSSVCANALELQEVTLAFLWLGDEGLLVDGATM